MHAASRIGRLPPAARTALALSLALIPTALLFLPALHYPLLNLDDVHAVTTNPGIRDLSLEGILGLFLRDQHEMRYFPLTYVSFAIDYHFHGLDPFGYHLTNLLLHLANTGLVFTVLLSLCRDRLTAALAALVFGIHPLNVESVAWVTSRKNVLFLFFFLLSVASYLRHVRGRGEPDGRLGPWLLASVGLYVAACLAKTAAITLPAVLVLIDYWRRPVRVDGLTAFLRTSLPDKLVFAVALIFVQAASVHFSKPNPFATEYAYSALEWGGIVAHNLFFYVARTLLPVRLGVFYPLPEPGALPPSMWAFAALAVALVALTGWAFASGRRTLFFGLAWYGATILPLALFAALFSDIPILVADRYVYQSLIGLAFLGGAGVSALWTRWEPRPVLRGALLVALALALGGLYQTAAEARSTWRSTIALYEGLLEHHPNDEFYYRLAAEYMSQGRREDAFRAVRAAREAPRKIFFLDLCSHQLRLAEIHRQMGEPDRAAEFVERAIEATPNFFEPVDARTPFAYTVLADLYDRAGNTRGAERARALAAGSQVDPRHYFAASWLAIAPEPSRTLLRRLAREHPDDGLPPFYLGVLAAFSGDEERSRELISRAAELGFPPEQPD